METYEELFSLTDRLKQWSSRAEEDDIKSPTDAMEQAATEVGRSFSGSWLGYHSRVYYDGLVPTPPGAHFSQEWGFQGEEWLGLGSKGAWREYDPEGVKRYILEQAGNPDLANLRELERPAQEEFEKSKAEITSILTAELDSQSDNFLSKLLDELNNLDLASRSRVIDHMRPRGQVMTRDTMALGQGTKVPPHFDLLAEAVSIRHTFQACGAAADIAAKAASHIERKSRKKRKSDRVGTNVFIGHGRSGAWRELKDFVQDRLRLPWDEFNRVPVAGVTNIARLSEMLEAASIAFLVMTAEDELADGEMQARMNVVHEAGLFQGRLGFTRAIVLLEEGCREFSNIQGLGQIRFPKGNIGAAFEEIRRVLEREGLVASE